jgi:hypothetical protein
MIRKCTAWVTIMVMVYSQDYQKVYSRGDYNGYEVYSQADNKVKMPLRESPESLSGNIVAKYHEA